MSDRTRASRFLDALTHTGPGYDTTPEEPATPTIDPLLILLSRAARGVLIPEEGDKLRVLVGELQQQIAELRRYNTQQAETIREAGELAYKAEKRAYEAEAAVDQVRRLCDLTIAASVRVQAVQQARDTLDILDQQPTTEATR